MDSDQWHEVRLIQHETAEAHFLTQMGSVLQQPLQLPRTASQLVPGSDPCLAVKMEPAVERASILGGRSPDQPVVGRVPLWLHRQAQRHDNLG